MRIHPGSEISSSGIVIPAHEHFSQLSFRDSRPFEFAQPGIDFRHVKSIGVKCTTDPLLHALVLGMFWILQGFQQLRVTPDTATILRRTRSSTIHTKGG